MKTIRALAVLLGMVLMILGCARSQTEPPVETTDDTSSVDQPAADGSATEPSVAPATTEQPADSRATEPSVENSGASQKRGKVVTAVAKALMKAITGTTGSDETDPASAPPFQP
jgi:hypothetical protein